MGPVAFARRPAGVRVSRCSARVKAAKSATTAIPLLMTGRYDLTFVTYVLRYVWTIQGYETE